MNITEQFIAMIPKAMTEQQLRDISYRAFCHPAVSGKDYSLITALCVYRTNYLAGKDDTELEMCRVSLKLTKKQVKNITKGA